MDFNASSFQCSGVLNEFSPTWKVHADICWRADNIGGKGLQGVTDLGVLDGTDGILDFFFRLESGCRFQNKNIPKFL